MTASHDFECAQADRVAERASRNLPVTLGRKLQAAAILAAGAGLFFAIVAGFVLA